VPENDATSNPASTAHLRVLIVDDSVAAAKILGLLLTKSGNCHTRLAHDGHSAIEAAQRFDPDVIFLDLVMPEPDGFAVAARLRAMPQFQSTLLVALTGNDSPEARRRSGEAGFDHHLLKPVGIEELQSLLSRVA
jgi:CheY-like chemotaxis protein